MPFFSAKTIKNLLKQNGFKPLKRLGQNFLISKHVLKIIIGAADLTPEDLVLEIGPGLGGLTTALAQKVGQVIAIEKDRGLAAIFRQYLKSEGVKNVELIEEDILNFQFSIFNFQSNKSYKVVANLPYNIATAVIMKFLDSNFPPELMVVLIQKEVGQRLCAEPPKMQKIAVFCQFLSQPKIVASVSKKSFYPQPKVDSAILKITPLDRRQSHHLTGQIPTLNNSVAFRKQVEKVVKAGFSQPRKQLENNFTKAFCLSREKVKQWLSENKIQPSQRAQTLTVQDWLNLTKTLK